MRVSHQRSESPPPPPFPLPPPPAENERSEGRGERKKQGGRMPVTFSPPRFPPQENEHGGERMGRRRSPKEVPFFGRTSLSRTSSSCLHKGAALAPSHKTEKEKRGFFFSLSLLGWGKKACFEHISCAYGHLGDFHGLCGEEDGSTRGMHNFPILHGPSSSSPAAPFLIGRREKRRHD